MAEGKPADQVAERGHRLAELDGRVVQVEDIFELIDAENQGHLLDGPDQRPSRWMTQFGASG